MLAPPPSLLRLVFNARHVTRAVLSRRDVVTTDNCDIECDPTGANAGKGKPSKRQRWKRKAMYGKGRN